MTVYQGYAAGTHKDIPVTDEEKGAMDALAKKLEAQRLETRGQTAEGPKTPTSRSLSVQVTGNNFR